VSAAGAAQGATDLLPPSVRVIVRDWLSSNHVLLEHEDGNVLVDSGYVTAVPRTLALLAASAAIDRRGVSLLVNTHCHSDHMGGNAAIAARYGCAIAIPEGEAPLIQDWDQQALLLAYADQRADRFRADELMKPGETRTWGNLPWQVLAAPGHDMGAVMLFSPEQGILISGDALWQNGFGFVMPREIDSAALPAARATLDLIASLEVRVLVPGHGEPFTDVAASLEGAYARLEKFERDPLRLASYAVKVLVAFLLLEKEGLALAGLPRYLQSVGIIRDFNARFLRMTPELLAQWVIAELLRSRAAVCADGFLLPR